MPEFKPIHDAHAIERVFVGIQFNRQLDDAGFKQIREIASSFKDDLPRQVEIQGLTVSFGQPGILPPPPSAGFLLQNIERNGTISSELRIETNSIVFRTDSYTRWNDVWGRAKKYFDILVPKYLTQANIINIHLNYFDKFAWDGPIDEFRPNLLLRPESTYICSHIYESKDLWHSHTGKFLRIDNHIKRLLNINLDCLDEQEPSGSQRRIINVSTVITDNFNQIGYTPTVIGSDEVIDFVDEHMSKLHTYSKNVFGNVINEMMCKRIGLLE